MQIPIVQGIYTDSKPDFRTAYPRNLVPVPKSNGISEGYLRPADGIVQLGTGVGVDRGGIEWNGVCYRVMGTKLVSIDSVGVSTILGDVGGSGQVTFDYSFDRLAVASGGALYYYDGTTFTQVTDPDIGTVVDVVWVDGYFMTTDGEFLIVTELNNPLAVNPLKYGSAEADPDPVVALLKVRNEIYALNRHTIEVFENVGGELFPFSRIEGAQVQRGAIGTNSCCVFMDAIAFMGGARNESAAIWIGANGQSMKLSSREIDEILSEYTEAQLSTAVMEAVSYKSHNFLYVHLPNRTIVYDGGASKELGVPVWFILTSGVGSTGQYRARNFVWCYNKWLVGDPTSTSHGYIDSTISTHYGNAVAWEFGTQIIYNESRGAIIHSLELVSLTGRVAVGTNPQISTSYSIDGLSYSQEKYAKVGASGDTTKRIVWLQQGSMRNWRIQRFKGTSDAHISMARLEAVIEPLNV
ncbi:MAG: packaged DNA stabilization protein [Ilumatobacteraceae bacterium]